MKNLVPPQECPALPESQFETADGDLLSIRPVSLGDMAALAKVEELSWSPAQRASLATIEARFTSGACLTIAAHSQKRGEIVGYVTALLDSDSNNSGPFPWTHYAQLAQSPAFSEPQNLYIVTISVLPDAPRGTGTQLVKAMAAQGAQMGLATLRYAIRLPSYAAHALQGMTAQEYEQGLHTGKFHEDLYKLAKNAGGSSLGLVKDYYDDPDSLDYGLLIEHNLERKPR
jgi:hypothetical protein